MKKLTCSFVVAGALAAFAQSAIVVDDGQRSVIENTGGGNSSVLMVPAMSQPGSQRITVEVENTPIYPTEARRVALVTQNHCSGRVQLPMSALTDTLTAKLSGIGFQVVNPANAIGTTQNRTAAGEVMPEASAVELGRMLNVEGVITASVLECTKETVGVPAVAYRVKCRVNATLVDGGTGATVCGATITVKSPNYTVAQFQADNTALYEDLLHAAAESCADQLERKVASANWTPSKAGLVTVNFGCNVLGADVQIDGMSMGTCPNQIQVAPGPHNVLVSYPPYFYDFNRRALFNTNGQNFAVVLQITPEGEKRNKNNLLFEEILDRISKTGSTDDYVRKTLADGTSMYWKNSNVNITQGTVQVMDLTPPGTFDETHRSPSPDRLIHQAEELTK